MFGYIGTYYIDICICEYNGVFKSGMIYTVMRFSIKNYVH